MVFSSKKSAALLLVSSASLFAADSSLVSVDNASKKIIEKLQTQCATLNGLLGKWTIESDKSVAAESARKAICDGVAQIKGNFGFYNDAPILALQDLHQDKTRTHIAYMLGVQQHVDTMFKILSKSEGLPVTDYMQHAQIIRNYINAAELAEKYDSRNPIYFLTQAAEQAQNDAVKVILLKRVIVDQDEQRNESAKILDGINTSRMNLNEKNKLKEQELQGEVSNVQAVQEANKKLINNNSYWKNKNAELEQQKLALEKECATDREKSQEIIDALRTQIIEFKKAKEAADSQVLELDRKKRQLENENAALRNPKKGSLLGSWFGSSSSDKKE